MSTTYIIAFRDGEAQEIGARSVAVQDGSIQLLNDAGDVIAAFPRESVRGVFPQDADAREPVDQDVVYTARDYAINHGIIPMIESLGLDELYDDINLDEIANRVLAVDGGGLRIAVDDDHFAEAVRVASTKR